MIDIRQHIRIVTLPEMFVASIQCTSVSPEVDTLNEVINFLDANHNLYSQSDIRHFGYVPKIDKRSNADIDSYVRMFTIPKDMKVPPPFEVQFFHGGLYAACTVPIEHFDKISKLREHVNNLAEYELVHKTEFDSIEEYINTRLFRSKYLDRFFHEAQLDLLVSIKKIKNI